MSNDLDRERTLVLVKPDGVQRGYIGEIISRFERRGFKIVGLKMMTISDELAGEHYGDHRVKPFFKPLVEFIMSSPVVAMAVQGRNVVKLVRHMMGALEPEEAAPGTIRGDLSRSKSYNVVHGSDCPENGKREVALFFNDDEIFDYQRDIGNWLKYEI